MTAYVRGAAWRYGIVETDEVYGVVIRSWLTSCIWLSSIVGTDKWYVVVIHSWN